MFLLNSIRRSFRLGWTAARMSALAVIQKQRRTRANSPTGRAELQQDRTKTQRVLNVVSNCTKYTRQTINVNILEYKFN